MGGASTPQQGEWMNNTSEGSRRAGDSPGARAGAGGGVRSMIIKRRGVAGLFAAGSRPARDRQAPRRPRKRCLPHCYHITPALANHTPALPRGERE